MLGIDAAKCTGCRMCEMACSLAHFDLCSRWLSRIRVDKNEEEGRDIPLVCTRCAEARCIASCPEEALTRDPSTGAIVLANERCSGCQLCVSACPLGAVFLRPLAQDSSILICDLCGGKTYCVDFCETGSLYREGPAGARERD